MKVEENKAKVIFIDEEGVERVFEKCFLMPIEPILDNDKETQITSYTPNLTGPEFMLAITNLAHIAGHFLNLMDNNEE